MSILFCTGSLREIPRKRNATRRAVTPARSPCRELCQSVRCVPSLGCYMRPPPSPPFRAEHIGSLVRPPRLLQARAQHAEGKLGHDELRAIEDDAIRGVVALQEEIGLNVVTDGEFRRGTYSDSFTSAGISGVQIELTEDQGW